LYALGDGSRPPLDPFNIWGVRTRGGATTSPEEEVSNQPPEKMWTKVWRRQGRGQG
jgi:hypothetical protein